MRSTAARKGLNQWLNQWVFKPFEANKRQGQIILPILIVCVAAFLAVIQYVILDGSPDRTLTWDNKEETEKRLTHLVTVLAALMLLYLWCTVFVSLYNTNDATPATILLLCIMILVVYSYVYTIISLYSHHEKHFLGMKPDTNVGYRYFDMVYFTATTMSTVGYGDISPLSYVARAVTISQYVISFAVVGVILSRLGGGSSSA